jgi:cation:H+ antiporter
MLLSALAILVGLGLLVWSADLFVEGASATAENLGVSSLIIGITVIGFGTSAPEILISIFSVFDKTPDLAIGNALGSNIANIGLILGITALILPLGIASKILKREFPILIIASIILSWTLWDLQLDFIDGLILLSSLFIGLFYLIRYSQTTKDDVLSSELDQEIPHDIPTGQALLLTLAGLLILVGSSKLLVWGAVNIATELGVSELIIGLTIVALGTSLPELAASIAGVKKNKSDLVIGNVVGSNLFNSLAVIGIPAMMTDFNISSIAINRDLSVTLGFTAALFLLAYLPKSSCCKLTRFKGGILLLGFVLYQSLLYYQVVNQS